MADLSDSIRGPCTDDDGRWTMDDKPSSLVNRRRVSLLRLRLGSGRRLEDDSELAAVQLRQLEVAGQPQRVLGAGIHALGAVDALAEVDVASNCLSPTLRILMASAGQSRMHSLQPMHLAA